MTAPTRQDPRRLYAAYGASARWKAWDGRPMPDFDKLGPKVQAHWTVTALCAAGLPVYTDHTDMALDGLARQLDAEDVERGGAVAELYWTLCTWARMSEAVRQQRPDISSIWPFNSYAATALTVALCRVGQQTVDALLGPLLHPGEATTASTFLRQLGTLGVATGALGARFDPTTSHAVALTFERIAVAYDHLEDGDQPRGEARLFRAASRLVRDLAKLEGGPTRAG